MLSNSVNLIKTTILQEKVRGGVIKKSKRFKGNSQRVEVGVGVKTNKHKTPNFNLFILKTTGMAGGDPNFSNISEIKLMS